MTRRAANDGPAPAPEGGGEHSSAVGATLAGIRDLFVRRRHIDPLPESVRLDGETVLVTGGTSGLGRAIAERLAARGARVVVTGRQARGLPVLGADALDCGPHEDALDCGPHEDALAASRGAPVPDEKIRAADEHTRSERPHAPVSMAVVDFAGLSSVRAFVDEVQRRDLRFSRVVQNAGIVAQRGRPTVDGFDEMEQVNVLAPTALLAALWRAGRIARSGGRPRVVVVGSEAHRSAAIGPIEAVGQPRSYGVGAAVAEYGRTKLMIMALGATLGRQLAGALDVFLLCPGAVNSNIAREAPAWSQPLLKATFTLAFQSPARAAEPAEYLTCAPADVLEPMTYLHLLQKKAPSLAVTDPTAGDALWARVFTLLRPHGFSPPTGGTAPPAPAVDRQR